MSRYWNNIPYYEQPTEAELKQKSESSRKKAESKGKKLEPIIVEGRQIARSWWGKAWCDNLEQYADYENRIGRGKKYIRSGAVIDLKIREGKITAKVQGNRKTPYNIEIRISPFTEEKCQQIIGKCDKVRNIEELIAGTFPDDMKELFQGKDGLFPEPNEISFHCSCPDWAIMCKHVAAALYGAGVRFDEQPLLFFELRGIDIDRFIDVVLEDKVEMMLANVDKPSDRLLETEYIGDIFGIRELV